MSIAPFPLPSAFRPLRVSEQTPVNPQQVQAVAQEFEAMMLAQMLKQMRQSMASGEEKEEGLGFGTETMTETVDVELAKQLSRTGGIGLTAIIERSMMQALAPGTAQPVPPVAAGHEALPGSVAAATAGGRFPDAAGSAVAAATTQAKGLLLPDVGEVSSEFGWRRDPFRGMQKFHKGVDLKAAYGRDVPSAAAGRVTFAGERGTYGLMVEISHANGATSRYAHLSATSVGVGDVVEGGQVVGRVGKSGRATGPHLHFEVLVDGRRVDPTKLASTGTGDAAVKKQVAVVD